MDHTVKISVQAGLMDKADVTRNKKRVMGGVGVEATPTELVQEDACEVIGVIIPHSMESGDHTDELNHFDIHRDPTIQIVTNCTQCESRFDVAISEHFGYVYNVVQAEQVRRNYEMQTNTSYVAVSNIRTNFGQTELSWSNHRIYWEEPQQDTLVKSSSRIEFDGVPFIMLAKRVLDCQHGRDWHKHDKEKGKVERKQRKKQLPQVTKKLGCLANITMREVICFPDFKIDDNSEYKRKLSSKKLRTALKEDEVKGQKRIYIDLPEASAHNHPVDQNVQVSNQTMDDRVSKKLQEIVQDGVVGVEDVRLQLLNYVKEEIFCGQASPPLTNRRFFPSKSSIRTHIHKCCAQQKQETDSPVEVLNHLATKVSTLNAMAKTAEQLKQQFDERHLTAQNIGQSFCQAYYTGFDSNRQQLETLYHKDLSTMCFEGDRKYGSAQIMAKLMSLPFTVVNHAITSLDCDVVCDDAILIVVLGQLQVDNDPKKTFHQTFILRQFDGTFYIVNDIFRLGMHNF